MANRRIISIFCTALFLFCASPLLAQRPSYQNLLARAEKALAAKDLEKAVVLYEKLANFYPNSSQAHNRLGYAHYLKGNDPRAIYSFRRALALSRRNDQALHNLLLASGRQADALARNNAFIEAQQSLDELIASYSWHPQHAVLLYYRGRMEFFRGKPKEGLYWWKRAARLAPNSGVAKIITAQSRPLNGKTIKLYEEASAKVQKEPAFDFLLGRRYLGAKQFDKAFTAFGQGLAKSREQEIPFPLLALDYSKAALATGNLPQAVDALEEGKRQRPDWSSLRTLLWPAFLESGREAAADQSLQEAFELDGKPKVAVLGDAEAIRVDGPGGSSVIYPPGATSVSPGKVKLTTASGQEWSFEVKPAEAMLYRLGNGELEELSVATLSKATGTAGQLAPPLVAKTRRGGLYRLSESLLKRPIVILFWHVEDNDASRQLTELGAIASRFEDEVETVAIHANPKRQKDAHRLYLSQPGTSAQLWGDDEVVQSFGLDEIPSLVVIDRSGRVTLSRTGFSGELFSGLSDYLENL